MLEGTEAWTFLEQTCHVSITTRFNKSQPFLKVVVEEMLTSGSTKVDDVAVFLEHVDLLNSLDGLDVHLLQGGLELLVVGAGGLVDLLDLAAGSTLASVAWLVCWKYHCWDGLSRFRKSRS